MGYPLTSLETEYRVSDPGEAELVEEYIEQTDITLGFEYEPEDLLIGVRTSEERPDWAKIDVEPAAEYSDGSIVSIIRMMLLMSSRHRTVSG